MCALWGILGWVRLFGREISGLRQVPRLVPVAMSVLVVTGTTAGVALVAVGGTPPPGPASASGRAPSVPPKHAAPVPLLGQPRSMPLSVPVAMEVPVSPSAPAKQPAHMAPLGALRQPDILIVAPSSLPRNLLAEVGKQADVTSAESLEAAKVEVNGEYAAILGVNASTFRRYATKSVAGSDGLWQGVANGGMAVSYSMGKLDKLPLGGTVTVSGRQEEHLPVVAFGTVGIAGVDAVVSDSVAASLGMPSANAMVISAPPQDVASLTSSLRSMVPKGAAVEPLVAWVSSGGSSASRGTVSSVGVGASVGTGSATGTGTGDSMTPAEVNTMLQAALSRRGMPYVWGAAGPQAFDCSGLVEWSFAQAGLTMPRVAADQALTGAVVPVSQLAPGDLLFYRTDPTDPGYISHVAIYVGNGWMIQAPQPGMDVQVVPVDLSTEFAGAIRVDPHVAADVATGLAG